MPDACEVLTSADIEAAFGIDPGAAEPSGDPGRAVCTYENGYAVGVTEGAEFESLTEIASAGGECSDAPGVGEKARFCITLGSAGRLFWLDGNLMYDLSGPVVEIGPFTELAGKVKV